MFELLTYPFFQRALLTGLIVGALLALLGVLVVLRRMSFFADAIGHSALPGIALALLFNLNPFLGALGFTLLVAATIGTIRVRSRLPVDTLLGIFFPAAVALGVMIVQRTPGYQTDLLAVLFGDILTVGWVDLGISLVIAIITIAVLARTGKALVSIAFDEALARTEGVPVARLELVFMLMLAAVIALAIKLVGIILVTAMLVIPAATAQILARSLASMFALSVAASAVAVIAGMAVSAAANLPSGPTIILVSAGLFAIALVARAGQRAAP